MAGCHKTVMRVQKDDTARPESDKPGNISGFTRRIAAKLGQRAMRGVHFSHASPPIASHLQHGYLTDIEGK